MVQWRRKVLQVDPAAVLVEILLAEQTAAQAHQAKDIQEEMELDRLLVKVPVAAEVPEELEDYLLREVH